MSAGLRQPAQSGEDKQEIQVDCAASWASGECRRVSGDESRRLYWLPEEARQGALSASGSSGLS